MTTPSVPTMNVERLRAVQRSIADIRKDFDMNCAHTCIAGHALQLRLQEISGEPPSGPGFRVGPLFADPLPPPNWRVSAAAYLGLNSLQARELFYDPVLLQHREGRDAAIARIEQLIQYPHHSHHYSYDPWEFASAPIAQVVEPELELACV